MRIYQFKKSTQWHMIKFTTIFIMLALTVFFCKNTNMNKLTNFSHQASTFNKLDSFQNTTTGTVNKHFEHVCAKINVYQGDKCEYSKIHCENALESGRIKYLDVMFCDFRNFSWLYYIVGPIWLLILFYLLGDTSENNFCPSLTQISILLKLSPDVAGVTFLALGNGAPDISATIVGIQSGSAGFGFGPAVGAGLFVTSAVMAAVTLSSPIKVDAVPFLRDILVYLFSVVFILACCFTGQVTLWQSILCFVIYGSYVGVVVCNNVASQVIKKVKEKRRKDYKGLPGDQDSEDVPDKFLGEDDLTQSEQVNLFKTIKQDATTTSSTRRSRAAKRASNIGGFKDENMKLIEDHFSVTSKIESSHEDDKEDKIYSDNSKSLKGRIQKSWEDFLEDIEWDEKHWTGKIFFFFEFSTIILRDMTIPRADPEAWNKFWAVVSPLFIPGFTLFVLELEAFMIGGYVPLILLSPLIGLPWSIFVFFTTKSRTPPVYHFVFVMQSFILSIMWIYLLASELVGLLQAVGIMAGINDAVLAITVLAWGNSIGDMIADVVVARQGFPGMAVGACFGGPCLNLLIGLGISITARIIETGESFPVLLDKTLLLTFLFLIASMVASIVVVPLSKFRSPKTHGILLGLLYVAFCIFGVLIELGVFWN